MDAFYLPFYLKRFRTTVVNHEVIILWFVSFSFPRLFFTGAQFLDRNEVDKSLWGFLRGPNYRGFDEENNVCLLQHVTFVCLFFI